MPEKGEMRFTDEGFIEIYDGYVWMVADMREHWEKEAERLMKDKAELIQYIRIVRAYFYMKASADDEMAAWDSLPELLKDEITT